MVKFSEKLNGTACGSGKLYSLYGDGPETVVAVGEISADRTSAAYRVSACWMGVRTDGNVPEETQYLLMKKGKTYTLLFALADGNARTSLFSSNGILYARVETYDSDISVGDARILYCIEGEDPYKAVQTAYSDMLIALGTFSLGRCEQVPRFADTFGFCTYNAMGSEVTEENLFSAMDMFKDNGISVGFVIADDGWHSHEGNMLAAYTENKRAFPHGLQYTIRKLKEDYGVKQFLCWHTYNGYWQGVKTDAFPELDVRTEYFNVPQRFRKKETAKTVGKVDTVTGDFYPDNIIDQPCGFPQGDLYSFYRSFYAYLASQGVDGSKLDAMAWIEAFSHGKGGRVVQTVNMVDGLERASREYFDGNHINCSSCSNDFFFHTHGVGVTRVSTDYFPNDTSSYFHHVYSSATVCFWMRPVIFGDWDMFQSGVAGGALHAKVRAVSGGPVYCSDNAETLDAEVILPLISRRGYVGKCTDNAVPTEDCLFFDGNERKLLKLCNTTPTGYVMAVMRLGEGAVTETVTLSEITGLARGRYAVYSDVRGFMGEKSESDEIETSLEPSECEVLTAVPVVNGKALIGLKDKYNPSGFVLNVSASDGAISATVIDDGDYLLYDRESGEVLTVSAAKPENGVLLAVAHGLETKGFDTIPHKEGNNSVRTDLR